MRAFIAIVLVFLLFSSLAFPAAARTPGTLQCTNQQTTTCTTKQQALDYAQLQSTATTQCVLYGHTDASGFSQWTASFVDYQTVNEGTSSEYITVRYKDVAPNGAGVLCGTVAFWWKPKQCATTDPPLSGGWVLGDWQTDTTLPTAVCVDGCQYNQPAGSRDVSCVDGQCWTRVDGFTAAGSQCAAGDATLAGDPPADADKDGVSDGNDGDPNNPGQSTPTGDNPPSGETNNSGDGSGNNNQSVGGGNCNVAPSSSGDAILAQIAYQSWATRCAIENAKDGNGNLRTTQGSGTGTGSGTGSTPGMGECTQGGVNQAICVSKEYLKKLSDFVTSLTDEPATLDTSEGELQEAQSIWDTPPEQTELNSAGYGLGGSCPAPPTYMGQSLDPNGYLCMFAGIIGALVLVAAYAQAAYIIGRS
ncbi:MAG TPA: hypothetical protein VGE33_06010 [Thermomonas sp.]